jgi:hypothetical protein
MSDMLAIIARCMLARTQFVEGELRLPESQLANYNMNARQTRLNTRSQTLVSVLTMMEVGRSTTLNTVVEEELGELRHLEVN